MKRVIDRLYHVAYMNPNRTRWLVSEQQFTSHADACDFAAAIPERQMPTVIEERVPPVAEKH